MHVVFGLFSHSISVFITSFFFFSLKHAMSTAVLSAFFPNLHVSAGGCTAHVESISVAAVPLGMLCLNSPGDNNRAWEGEDCA